MIKRRVIYLQCSVGRPRPIRVDYWQSSPLPHGLSARTGWLHVENILAWIDWSILLKSSPIIHQSSSVDWGAPHGMFSLYLPNRFEEAMHSHIYSLKYVHMKHSTTVFTQERSNNEKYHFILTIDRNKASVLPSWYKTKEKHFKTTSEEKPGTKSLYLNTNHEFEWIVTVSIRW